MTKTINPQNVARRETILALATGAVRSAIAILRLSGPASRFVIETIANPCPEPRRASLRQLRASANGELLDEALVLWFPGPTSFSGEDMAEFHIHGGPAVITAVMRAILALPGCRLADPGEFSRRAFLAGRIDLSAAEGIADLVDAQTDAQRRQALRQMDGSLARAIETWRDGLVDSLAQVEAELDFADEDDVPDSLIDGVRARIGVIRGEIAMALAEARHGERLREGFTVVIAGAPNAGKSTLFNRLVQRDTAIVSPVAGTTRDAIEAGVDMDGLPIILVDTAGLRVTDDVVELEGIRRARLRVAAADLVLALEAIDSPAQPSDGWTAPTLRVWTKADRADPPPAFDGLTVAAVTGFGIGALQEAIATRAREALGTGSALLTRERHREAIIAVMQALDRSLDVRESELLAEELRMALRALGRVTGRVGVEDVLDRVFSSFCIGK